MNERDYNLILSILSSLEEKISKRSEITFNRAHLIKNAFYNKKIVKQAFDTRRINPEIQFNPRRNLQNYIRSEAFIDNDLSHSINSLFKLKNVVDLIKNNFQNDPNWLDSNCRILSSTIDRVLRTEQKDFDFAKPQFDYLNELLYLRYRINSSDLDSLSEDELKKIILSKDEKLSKSALYNKYNMIKQTAQSNELTSHSSTNLIQKTNEESFLNKLFETVSASKDAPERQKSITITINDKIFDK